MTQPVDPNQPPVDPNQEAQQSPSDIRSQLMASIQDTASQPDLAASTYQSMGFNAPGVSIKGVRAKMQDLQPGDLVGWEGAQEQDGRYIGNIAIYAGQGEVIEHVFGHNRRRKLGFDENTFGIPVNLPQDYQQ